MLSLLLVFAQLGAVLHELGHLSQAGAAAATLDRSSSPPTAGRVPDVPGVSQGRQSRGGACHAGRRLPGRVHSPVAEPCYAIVGADTPTPRSRGPPQV